MFSDTDLCKFSKGLAASSAEYIVEILNHEIKKNHDLEDHTLAKLILIITEMREHKEMTLSSIKNYLNECMDLGIPRILMKVYEDD